MFPPFENDRLLGCAVGGLLLVLGLSELLLGKVLRGAAWRGPLFVGGLLVLSGLGLALAGEEMAWWLTAIGLGVVAMILGLLRAAWAEEAVTRLGQLIRRPQVQALCVLLLGGSLLASQLHALDEDLQATDLLDVSENELQVAIDLKPVHKATGLTDSGNTIVLYTPDEKTRPTSEANEQAYVNRLKLDGKVIRLEKPTLRYNCHGWIFAEGKHWIRGTTVDDILRDNHYEIVKTPAVGDVAIFRDQAGVVSHSALVHSIAKDGTILLESKWGQLGRYLHTTTQHAYTGHSITYYHTTRGGHQLRIEKGPNASGL